MLTCQEIGVDLQNIITSFNNIQTQIIEAENYICSSCGISNFNCNYLLAILKFIQANYEQNQLLLNDIANDIRCFDFPVASGLAGQTQALSTSTNGLKLITNDIIEMTMLLCNEGQGTCKDIYNALFSLCISSSQVSTYSVSITNKFITECKNQCNC